jgi:hypothetical protein
MGRGAGAPRLGGTPKSYQTASPAQVHLRRKFPYLWSAAACRRFYGCSSRHQTAIPLPSSIPAQSPRPPSPRLAWCHPDRSNGAFCRCAVEGSRQNLPVAQSLLTVPSVCFSAGAPGVGFAPGLLRWFSSRELSTLNCQPATLLCDSLRSQPPCVSLRLPPRHFERSPRSEKSLFVFRFFATSVVSV